MKVPYLDLASQFSDPELRRAVMDLFCSCHFILGPQVEELEKRFAKLCGTRFALGLNSGTDALFLALKALGIGSGDEVITVSNSFIATAGAIAATGARPIFVDVSPDYNIDPAKITAAITDKTRAILPVHLTGNPADMPRILEISKRHGLAVIEDAAQAVGAEIKGIRTGSFGDFGCFSLHPLKNLNAAGDAGILTTDSEELFEKTRRLRNHGFKNRDEIDFFGYNSRMDSIQAAIVLERLKKLESVTESRRANAALYDKLLAPLVPSNLAIPPRRPEVKQVYHTYVVQVENRENLVSYLAERGVETKIHYPTPIHLQMACRAMGWKEGDLPLTETQSKRILTLPVHQGLAPEQIEFVCSCIRNFYSD